MNNFSMEKTARISALMYEPITKELSIKNYAISFSIVTDAATPSENDIIAAHLSHDISYSKAMFMFDTLLQNAIFYPQEASEEVLEQSSSFCSNMLVCLPAVTEVFMCATLHSKLNSITKPETFISDIKLNDLENDTIYNYSCEQELDVFLPVADDWFGEHYTMPTPWWCRNDQSTYDVFADSKEELTDLGDMIELLNNNTEALNISRA